MRTLCSNPECEWSRCYKGGRFIWRGANPFCEDCARLSFVMNDGASTDRWNFTTTNIHPEGKPIHVQSLRHLRQLEGQYGVSCAAANQSERSWSREG